MNSHVSKISSANDALIVHQVDISHIRLVELSTLADQAKPFYSRVVKHV